MRRTGRASPTGCLRHPPSEQADRAGRIRAGKAPTASCYPPAGRVTVPFAVRGRMVIAIRWRDTAPSATDDQRHDQDQDQDQGACHPPDNFLASMACVARARHSAVGDDWPRMTMPATSSATNAPNTTSHPASPPAPRFSQGGREGIRAERRARLRGGRSVTSPCCAGGEGRERTPGPTSPWHDALPTREDSGRTVRPDGRQLDDGVRTFL